MQPEERQKRIETYLQQAEFASLEELAAHLGVSVSTVRRDLAVLEGKGNIRRTYGGARLLNPQSEEFIFARRDTRQLEEKEAIGRRAAMLAQPGQTLIVDAGSTAYHVARHLGALRPQIITNSLPVANLFASTPAVELILTGGVVYPRLGVMLGPVAVEALGKMHAEVAFMGAGGMTFEGVTNSHALLIEVQRAMLRAADRVVLCVDHTKLGRRSVAFLCEPEKIDAVVTDEAAPLEVVEGLRDRGIEVCLAPLNLRAPARRAAGAGS